MVKVFFPVKEPRKRDRDRHRFGLKVGKKTYRIDYRELIFLQMSIMVARKMRYQKVGE